MSRTYRTILVALDLSEEGDLLIRHASQLAECYDAELSLVHVVEYVPLDISEDYAAVDSALLSEEMLEHARQAVTDQARNHGIDPSRCYVEVGSTKGEIKRIVEETGAELLVVGSHTRHGLALLLGSTTNSLLNNVACDVLAVHVSES
jgi:universal stress protein A